MSYKVKSKGCCDCTFGLTCGLTCQVKQGIATLCGFDTYVPTTPLEKYRRRTVSGTMTVCSTGDPLCAPPTCPASVDLSASGPIIGFGGTFEVSGALTNVGGTLYTASSTAIWHGTTTDQVMGSRVQATIGGGTPIVGSTPLSLAAGIGNAVIQVYVGYWASLGPPVCFESGLPPVSATLDDWAIVSQYDKTTCLLSQTDTSNRESIAGNCSGTGVSAVHLFTNPAGEYGAGITQSITATQIKSDGIGCLPPENPGGLTYSGEVTESLNDQDTTDDAIARMPIEWGFGDCQTIVAAGYLTAPATDGSFAFRKVQVFATIGSPIPLIVGHSYDVRIGFWRKALGSGGPYVFFAFYTLSITADAPTDRTPWIDVPNAIGYQTAALTCAYHDTTP